MKLGIGVDTGGTYTDAIVYDFETGKVLDSTKALTTRQDLSLGIMAALDSLDEGLLRRAELVSLSTTLATNACVENKGGRAKLLFIGVDETLFDWVGGDFGFSDKERVFFLNAKTSIDGSIHRRPDWETFWQQSEAWFQDAEALGIVELYAPYNGAQLELEARDRIAERYRMPILCGHELFSDLGVVRRGVSTLLNGQLIPVLAEFLQAIQTSLGQRDLRMPVTIMRSDGTLMSERFSGAHPVETILCGPAASVVGGNALAAEPQAIIVDMGGTTTDIAFIRDGAPVKVAEGIQIGPWHTFVKGVYVETFGLGGDSAVRYDKAEKPFIDTRRVVPLSIAATHWPDRIVPKLQALLLEAPRHSRYLHEFFLRVKDIGDNPHYSDTEKAFCRALAAGPLIYTEAAAAIGRDPYNLSMERLEQEGVVMRCGLTPTDIMHLRGDFTAFSTEAAALGAQFVAASTGMDVPALCHLVYDLVKRSLYHDIVTMLLKERMPALKKEGIGGQLESVIRQGWELSKSGGNENLRVLFHTDSVLVGVGAPIHIFLPDVAKALGTACRIPEMAATVNAVGAVAGNITCSHTIKIVPKEDRFEMIATSERLPFDTLEEATEHAERRAAAWVRAEAKKRGANGEIVINSVVEPVTAETGYGSEIFLESRVTATAIGRIRF